MGFAILCGSGAALAHERFIKHNLKDPLPEVYYGFFRTRPDGVLGFDPNLLLVASAVTLVLAGHLFAWFFRQPLEQFIQFRLLGSLSGPLQKGLHLLLAFFTDRPVRHRLFRTLGEWAVILFMRCPALVLMYSATNDSLVMPSYPLDPHSALVFKYLQVLLALLILGQMLLPLCGAIIFGTWLFLFNWGPLVAADALPVLTVAVVYVTSPWHSHRLAITELNTLQVRWIRIVLGFGFLALGWLKLVNHDLVAAVAQNYPSAMEDPLIGLFTLFTASSLAAPGMTPELLKLTGWIVAFGLAEVMSGFMLMTGVFTRLWCTFMVFVFTKLMFVDFGWAEIPHIYPISALASIMLSNRLTDEFGAVEAYEEAQGRAGRHGAQIATVALASGVVAFLVIFPTLWLTTRIDRAAWGLRLSQRAEVRLALEAGAPTRALAQGAPGAPVRRVTP